MRERFFYAGGVLLAGVLIFLGRDLLPNSVIITWVLTLAGTALAAALTAAFYRVRAELRSSRHQLARNEAELSFALQVQKALFPKNLPGDGGLEFSATCIPARVISGDYYDILRLEDGRLVFLLADISGKGIPAAILMANLQALLRSASERWLEPAEVCRHLNRHLCQVTEAPRFATLFYGQWNPASARFTYVNAGHNPPLALGSCAGHLFGSGGYPLGLFPDAQYDAGQLSLEVGDLICLYSDGITEKGESRGHEFGIERLERILLQWRDRPLTELQQHIIQEVGAWGDNDPEDDMTLMLVRVLPQSTQKENP